MLNYQIKVSSCGVVIKEVVEESGDNREERRKSWAKKEATKLVAAAVLVISNVTQRTRRWRRKNATPHEDCSVKTRDLQHDT